MEGEEAQGNASYFTLDERSGRDSASSFSSDDDVDGFDDGADTPSKFAPRSSSKHMTELEWASFGAADAGLGAEILNINEHAARVASSSTGFFSELRDGLTKDQIGCVAAALFSDPPPVPRDHSNNGSNLRGAAANSASVPTPPLSRECGGQGSQDEAAPSRDCQGASRITLDELTSMARR